MCQITAPQSSLQTQISMTSHMLSVCNAAYATHSSCANAFGTFTCAQELIDRGVKIPKLATRGQLCKKLERMLDEEEEREARALAEAER
jgi:hypothetical protein